MEKKLQKLIEAGQYSEEVVREWKESGGKVIGYLCSYVPEEVIYAAGMLPFRVLGTPREDDFQGRVHLTSTACSYCKNVLHTLLSGELDFLDGLVTTTSCMDMVNVMANWRHAERSQFAHLMYLPWTDKAIDCRIYARSVRKLIMSMEGYWGVRITGDSLGQAIALVNETRSRLTKLYELRKREAPPVWGSESIGITTAAMVMEKGRFNKELDGLWEYLTARRISAAKGIPRLLLTGSVIVDRAYVQIIEDAGGIVVMEDLCTGYRYFSNLVDADLDDPITALAVRYLGRPPCARMFAPERRIDMLIEWVREFEVEGVIYFPLMYCAAYQGSQIYVQELLKKAGIPMISVLHEHHLSSIGQLKTRIEAFLEMLDRR